jgi:prepilin-type N-terminal cleavage/methylation domain-containing protein/prepilin-type processing-associated H-X9-DG protein
MVKSVAMAQPKRAGFTLVELLVVIAIIGVLVALLLPAVQAAREAARRSQCSNNLKQMGLAMHNYHDTYNVFPPRKGGTSAGNPNGNSNRRSGFLHLLPFMEQRAIFEQMEAPLINPAGTEFNAGGPGAWWNSAPPNHYPPWFVQLKIVICPSDKPVFNVNQQGKHSYAFSAGDTIVNNNSNNIFTRGVFGASRYKGFNHITDGSSNTIAMSERTWGNNLGIVTATGQDVRTATGHNVTSVNTDPGSCYATATGKMFVGVQIKARFGFLWADGQAERMAFTTVLPPNAPSCTNNDNVNADAAGGVFNPSSFHPNGVMALFADGSVRFVAENIHCGNISAPPVPQGPSPYGVWGAMGTTDGNESISNM